MSVEIVDEETPAWDALAAVLRKEARNLGLWTHADVIGVLARPECRAELTAWLVESGVVEQAKGMDVGGLPQPLWRTRGYAREQVVALVASQALPEWEALYRFCGAKP